MGMGRGMNGFMGGGKGRQGDQVGEGARRQDAKLPPMPEGGCGFTGHGSQESFTCQPRKGFLCHSEFFKEIECLVAGKTVGSQKDRGSRRFQLPPGERRMAKPGVAAWAMDENPRAAFGHEPEIRFIEPVGMDEQPPRADPPAPHRLAERGW